MSADAEDLAGWQDTELSVPRLQEYDDVPYSGGVIANTHPSHLAAVARLCGLNPPAVRKCRVLEIGCAVGENIIPMAEDLCDSEFVGFDLSARQIVQGQGIIKELGLKNIELHHLDVLDVDDRLGEFDYIICHGVYSWVPGEVQSRILDIARRQMTSTGVIYVSYNTNPGWYFRGVLRDMMRYHVADVDDIQARIEQARALLKFVSEAAPSESYRTLLKQESEYLERRRDFYLFHEHLGQYNEPIYFHEFVSRVESAGLRYVAETSLRSMIPQLGNDQAAATLGDLPLLKREQYLDFLTKRYFRSSVLCHSEQEPNYAPGLGERLLSLHVGLAQPLASKRLSSEKTAWRSADFEFVSQLPMLDAALEKLNQQCPAWIPVQQLVDNARLALEPDQSDQFDGLLGALAAMIWRDIVDVADAPRCIANQLSDKPMCSPVVRFQARHGDSATTLRHDGISIKGLPRFLLSRLDGTQSCAQLEQSVTEAIKAGQIQIRTHDGQGIQQLDSDVIHETVEQALTQFVAFSLLMP